jgi:hypothetical protein
MKTLSQQQNEAMAVIGYEHVGEDCLDPSYSVDAAEYYNFVDKSYTGCGYTICTGVAYEEDGNTVKQGFIRIFYN